MALAATPSPTIGNASAGAAFASPLPRRRKVLVDSQAIWRPTRTSVTTSNAFPFGCGWTFDASTRREKLLADPDPPVLGDLVGDVDEADRAEGEVAV